MFTGSADHTVIPALQVCNIQYLIFRLYHLRFDTMLSVHHV